MRDKRLMHPETLAFGLTVLFLALQPSRAQKAAYDVQPVIPRVWDDEAIANLEVPLADPIGSPKHVPANYYYRIPVAPIYKSHPIYAPGHEPPGYLDWLREQEPAVVWDDTGHAPPLQTGADWIRAGEIAFEAPTDFDRFATVAEVRDPVWYKKIEAPVTKDGTNPFFRYVIRKKGSVEVGQISCAMCHTRVLPDGSILKGAQGNFPSVKAVAFSLRARAQAKDSAQFQTRIHLMYRAQFAVPWLSPDPAAPIDQMSLEQIATLEESFPPSVVARQRTSLFYPVQIPDLIGIKDRRYLDRTGLQQHRSIADLMRYAAMNRGRFDGGDSIANHHGFIPADPPRFQKLPDPSTQSRYSDEQLYALAVYVYNLQPPSNPNQFDALAQSGQKVRA